MDSSGLAKLLIPDEIGADIVRTNLHPANQPTTSMVTYAECRAAIASAQGSQAVQILDGIWPSLFRIAVDDVVIRLAGNLVDRHKLRGFDAIYLASALGLGADAAMVSWDKDLVKATHDDGMNTIPS